MPCQRNGEREIGTRLEMADRLPENCGVAAGTERRLTEIPSLRGNG